MNHFCSNIINENCIDLYRIMPLERFLQMLYTMQNVLVRPSSWDDPYEKIFMKSAIMKDENELIQYDESRWYGQCWSFNNDSDSLWRAFTKGTNARAVKIKTTSDALMSCFNNVAPNHYFFLFKLKYSESANGEKQTMHNLSQTYQFDWEFDEPCINRCFNDEPFKDDPHVRALYMLLTKRTQFKAEDEVRLICYSKTPETKSVLQYPIPNIGDFLKEVVLDPWTPDGIDDVVSDIVKRYIPGRSISVWKSDLYQEPQKGLLYDPYHYYDEYIKLHSGSDPNV